MNVDDTSVDIRPSKSGDNNQKSELHTRSGPFHTESGLLEFLFTLPCLLLLALLGLFVKVFATQTVLAADLALWCV